MFAFPEGIGCRFAEPFQGFDPKVAHGRLGFFHAKMRYLEVLVVETVQQEIQKIRNHCLCAFAFQKFHQVVVGCRQEFYKDLADYAYSWFLNIQKFDVVVKVSDDLPAQLFEPPSGGVALGEEVCADFFPLCVHGVGGAWDRLIRTDPVYAFHENVSKYRGVDAPESQHWCDLKSWIVFQSA